MNITLTLRERDTIIAALRYYQNDMDLSGERLHSDVDPEGEINEIASDSGEPGLAAYEIDQLIENKLNP